MKYVFLVAAVVLLGAGYVVRLYLPDTRESVPVIYWVTDPNPARFDQVKLFDEWIKKNNHPAVKLKLDTSNADITKKVIQGVSGVGGDVMDLGSGAGIRYFQEIGIIVDVTDSAQELGFGPDKTYAALRPEIGIDLPIMGADGTEAVQWRQFGFPCNVSADGLVVNRGSFERLGMDPPPRTWTIDEFEKIGLEYIRRANLPENRGKRKAYFFQGMQFDVLRRSYGSDRYNETMTAPTTWNFETNLADPAFVSTVTRLNNWIAMGLRPSKAEEESMSVSAGYGGKGPQLLNDGTYAMIWYGRYLYIQTRKFDELRLASGQPLLELEPVEPPHAEFRNTNIGTRQASVYIDSKHPELAPLFLAFLASEEYNQQIVADADALPPNPTYARTEAFNNPVDRPNEKYAHRNWMRMAEEIAIGGSYSPFLQTETANRIQNRMVDEVTYGMSPTVAAYEISQQMAEEMDRTMKEIPGLRDEYERRLPIQKAIDEKTAVLKALSPGSPVTAEMQIPREWIYNPFHEAYYDKLGWLTDATPDAVASVTVSVGATTEQGQ